MFRFQKNEYGTNEIMRLTENCYVSFNGWADGPPLKCDFFRADGGSPETALVIDGKFYILNGDFRDQFQKAADEDIAKVLDVIKDNQELKSSWSDDADISDWWQRRVIDSKG